MKSISSEEFEKSITRFKSSKPNKNEWLNVDQDPVDWRGKNIFEDVESVDELVRRIERIRRSSAK